MLRILLAVALLLAWPLANPQPLQAWPIGHLVEEGILPTKLEQRALDFTNAERKAAGLPELKFHPKLLKAARGHSLNMAKQEKFEHVLDGAGHYDRAHKAGYTGKSVGENIACGYPNMTAKEAVAEWMSSPPHKANLLGKTYDEVGIAVAEGKNGTVYWTQLFGVSKLNLPHR